MLLFSLFLVEIHCVIVREYDIPECIMLAVWLVTGRQSAAPVWCMSSGRAAESPLRAVKESLVLKAWQVMTLDVHPLRVPPVCHEQGVCRYLYWAPQTPLSMLMSSCCKQTTTAGWGKALVIRAKRCNLILSISTVWGFQQTPATALKNHGLWDLRLISHFRMCLHLATFWGSESDYLNMKLSLNVWWKK